MTKGVCPEIGKIAPYVPVDHPQKDGGVVLFGESFQALPPLPKTTEQTCPLRRALRGKELFACEECQHYGTRMP